MIKNAISRRGLLKLIGGSAVMLGTPTTLRDANSQPALWTPDVAKIETLPDYVDAELRRPDGKSILRLRFASTGNMGFVTPHGQEIYFSDGNKLVEFYCGGVVRTKEQTYQMLATTGGDTARQGSFL